MSRPWTEPERYRRPDGGWSTRFKVKTPLDVAEPALFPAAGEG